MAKSDNHTSYNISKVSYMTTESRIQSQEKREQSLSTQAGKVLCSCTKLELV